MTNMQDITVKLNFYKNVIVVIVLVSLILFLFNGIIFKVEPGYRGFLITLGKPGDTIYSEGWYFKKPFIDTVVLIDIRVQKAETTASAASKDLQNVDTSLAVNYSLKPDKVIEIYTNIGNEYAVTDKLVNPIIQEVIKQTTAKYTAEELVTKRNNVSSDLKQGLIDKLDKYGINIADVSITNFKFSSQFEQAIENKVTAEQNAQAEKNKLDIIKYQAQQQIEKAKGEAEANITKAKAEAEAIKIKTQAIQAQGGADYVKLKWIEKWNGLLPNTMMGDGQGIIVNLNK